MQSLSTLLMTRVKNNSSCYRRNSRLIKTFLESGQPRIFEGSKDKRYKRKDRNIMVQPSKTNQLIFNYQECFTKFWVNYQEEAEKIALTLILDQRDVKGNREARNREAGSS